MWVTVSWWKDASWRAFRTFCQSMTGLLIATHVSNAFNAPWIDLIGASLLAGLTSLLMSVDRSTEATTVDVSVAPEPVTTEPVAPVASFVSVDPVATVTPLNHSVPVDSVCGDSLR